MAVIVVRIAAGGRTGSVELREGPPRGRRWAETTIGGKFVGFDHQGSFSMGSYATAGSMFLNERNRSDDDRELYPEAGVLVLNGFTYPGAAVGQRGTGNLQESSGVNAVRDWYASWEVTAVR